MDYLVIPDYVERKGSLYLRSDHMNYGRTTLNSNWHQAREAEPKHYDVNDFPAPPGRNLHTTTYERIGHLKGDVLPKTTTQTQLEQIELIDDFTERATRLSMIDMGSVTHANLDREIPSAPTRGFGAVLPRHHPDHDKMHLETTHHADFVPPYSYTPVSPRPPDFSANSPAYRKCVSQFTDTSDYRRVGRNTWQDETGVYANSDAKRKAFPKTSPIPERLTEGLL